MYQIALCDGDPKEVEQIHGITERVLREGGIEAAITVYESPLQLLKDLHNSRHQYDLYLIDILMGNASGVELAHALRSMGIQARSVFISNSQDFWRDGYKVEASDYLLKPVDSEELSQVLRRLLKAANVVALRVASGRTISVSAESISWAEAFDHTTEVHTINGNYTVLSTLGEVEKGLPRGRFYRCHRSYLVNLDYVEQVDRTSLRLIDGTRIPVSRGNSQKIKEAIIYNAEGSITVPKIISI